VLRDDDGKARFFGILDAFVVGAKYAISVGAAAATVGIIIGIVTLTGVGFKLSTIITGTAGDLASLLGSVLPVSLFDAKAMTLFFTLVMTAIVCILLGCGDLEVGGPLPGEEGKSVTHVSGMPCYLCLRKDRGQGSGVPAGFHL